MTPDRIKEIEGLIDRLNEFADGDVHEARRDALIGMHPEQQDYNSWADLMTQAASALRELLEERQWKEIDSAPKDGTYILGFLKGRFGPDQSVIKWTGDTWMVFPTRDGRLSFLATHYMPLPVPPEEGEGK